MICPYCNDEHGDGARFCPQTGAELSICPHCNGYHPAQAVFCPQTGQAVQAGYNDYPQNPPPGFPNSGYYYPQPSYAHRPQKGNTCGNIGLVLTLIGIFFLIASALEIALLAMAAGLILNLIGVFFPPRTTAVIGLIVNTVEIFILIYLILLFGSPF